MSYRCAACTEPHPPQSARLTTVTCDSPWPLIDSWGVDLGRRPAFFLRFRLSSPPRTAVSAGSVEQDATWTARYRPARSSTRSGEGSGLLAAGSCCATRSSASARNTLCQALHEPPSLGLITCDEAEPDGSKGGLVLRGAAELGGGTAQSQQHFCLRDAHGFTDFPVGKPVHASAQGV